ncbi:MAG: RNA-binding protein [Lentisphaeria bacterium]|jgi:RNA recognition motif-containing protein
MNIYVGNLSFKTTEDSLRTAFEQFGAVRASRVVTDKFTGKSKGFAFVEMDNAEEANKAIAGMDGKDLDGRTLRVNESRPREEGGFGGGERRGGGGGGFGGGERRGGFGGGFGGGRR